MYNLCFFIAYRYVITKIFYFSQKLEEMKTLQKLRKRQNGVSIATLALGKKVVTEDETLVVRDDHIENY